MADKRQNDLREALAQLIDPLGVVVLTRDRIEEALQDAVSRGRVTADDAQDLAATLIDRGRRQTNDIFSDLESLLSAKAGKARRAVGMTPRGSSKPKRPSFPIAGYEDLSAVEAQKRLDGLSADELRKVRAYEAAHASRKTVLRAIDKRL
jgi:polyhydroxyalkanoate synthesis regulator phasin